MNNATPPFNDVRVRRAFHLAVDKRDIVELVLFGQGTANFVCGYRQRIPTPWFEAAKAGAAY